MKQLTMLTVAVVAIMTGFVHAQEHPSLDTRRGDEMVAEYFRQETQKIARACRNEFQSLQQWKEALPELRRQLREMLGLDPLPPRTDLHAQITGTVEGDGFVVEKLHFQSRPGLYVTGNLYRPMEVEKPLPAILYVCGHGGVKKNGISYGNKVYYQHHGAWFARNGYVCLTIDSLQLGEIEAIHHGTYRYDMWWWLNRGYTPAGVEAWNCMRALDYLSSRPDVDGSRLGVTGRSGGGAYSWWIASLDERIQCAVPVAGITDLQNHVVDGCVEGHCDCMYFVNTYRWDYPRVAQLVAPRPLLISNSDSDRIFPLDGVVRTFNQVRQVYTWYGAADRAALNITAGPHKDTQELRIHAFRWMNHFLREDDSLIDKPAIPFFEPEQLKVFKELPSDEKNTQIQETFVAVAPPPPFPNRIEQWVHQRDQWHERLLAKTFAPWPAEPDSLAVRTESSASANDVRFTRYEFTSQSPFRLPLYVVSRDQTAKDKPVTLHVLDEASWWDFLATYREAFAAQLGTDVLPKANPAAWEAVRKQLDGGHALAYVAPRGIGLTAWDQSEKKQVQHRRRFYLLGQTLDGMRVWDVRRAIETLRSLPIGKKRALSVKATGPMAGVALYASLFELGPIQLDLDRLPASHRQGPFLLNVRRTMDLPQAVAMAAEMHRVRLTHASKEDWEFPLSVAARWNWDPEKLQIVPSADESP